MRRNDITFSIAYGAGVTFTLILQNNATPPTAVDVTGYTARMQILKYDGSVNGTVKLELASADGEITVGTTNGTFVATITAAQSTALATDFGSPPPTEPARWRFFVTPPAASEVEAAHGQARLLGTGAVIVPTSATVTAGSYVSVVSALGTPGPAGPTVEVDSDSIGAVPALSISGGMKVASSDRSHLVDCVNELRIESFSSVKSLIAAANAKKSCRACLTPGVTYTETDLNAFTLGEGVVLDGGGNENQTGGTIILTGSTGPLINFDRTFACSLKGVNIQAPNLRSDQDIFSSFGNISDTAGFDMLHHVYLIGGTTMTAQGTSTTSLNTTTLAASYAVGPVSVTISTQAGLSLFIGDYTEFRSTGAPTAVIGGCITAYAGNSLSLNVSSATGAGAHTDWAIYTRYSPTGCRIGQQINTSITSVNGLRLRSLLRADGYVNAFKADCLNVAQMSLAGIWNATGEAWDINTFVVEPAADGRGNAMGYDSTSSGVSGLTINNPWWGDLDSLHYAGPWADIYGGNVTIRGGRIQGSTGHAVRCRNLGNSAVASSFFFHGTSMTCTKGVQFVTDASNGYVEICTPNLTLANAIEPNGLITSFGVLSSDWPGWYRAGKASYNSGLKAGVLGIDGSSAINLTANVDDFNPSGAGVVEFSPDANGRTINSMNPSLIGNGQFLFIYNASTSFTMVLKHAAVSGTAAYRFSLAGGADITLAPGQGGWAWYSPQVSRWRFAVSP